MDEVVEKYQGATTKIKQEAPKDGKEIGESLAQPIVTAMDDAGEQIGRDLMGSIGRELRNPQTGIGKIVSGGIAEAISTGDFKGALEGAATSLGTMIAGPIGGAIAGRLAGAVLKSGPSAAQRAEGAFGGLLRGFEGAAGDLGNMGALVGELGGIFDSQTGEIKETGAAVKLGKSLKDFGLTEKQVGSLLNEYIAKNTTGARVARKRRPRA
jgi:hypothetical protein